MLSLLRTSQTQIGHGTMCLILICPYKNRIVKRLNPYNLSFTQTKREAIKLLPLVIYLNELNAKTCS